MMKTPSAAKEMRRTDETVMAVISADECESMAWTAEVLADKDIMDQIEAGKKDNVKIMNFEELARELGV